MSVYPGAIWEPITGGTDGPMGEYLGAVLHVNQSDGADLFNWEQGGAHDMSSHFQIASDGRVFQYLDTATDSWCQMAGNRSYISIETQGFNTDPLTDAQVTAIAGLYRWLHETHAVPYALAEQPGQPGFGWHGMGGDAWGGHPDCPGDQRRAQRAQILQLAQEGDDFMALFATVDEFKAAVRSATWANTGTADEGPRYWLFRFGARLFTGKGNAAFPVPPDQSLVPLLAQVSAKVDALVAAQAPGGVTQDQLDALAVATAKAYAEMAAKGAGL